MARDLATRKEALRGRVRRAGAGRGSRPDLLTTAERTERVQPRKEPAGLRRAKEMKAASVFPAKELDQPRTGADAVINHLRDDFGAPSPDAGMVPTSTRAPRCAGR